MSDKIEKTAQSADKKGEKSKKVGIGKRISKFGREFKAEVKKIVWPGRKSVTKSTIIVIISIIIIGALVALFDFGLTSLLGLIVNR